MSFVSSITLRNFRSFRTRTTINLEQLTYLVGGNNAGKTNVLQGLRAFFDDTYFQDATFLNRAEFLAKKTAYNRSELEVQFNLLELSTKVRKARLTRRYGERLTIQKIITFAPESETIGIHWKVGGEVTKELRDEVKWLLNSVKVTYIHPQDGKLLLGNVQARLRQRLLANWGRNATLTHALNELEDSWKQMRDQANRYLSQSLSQSLQNFWPESSIVIDLPKNLREVVEISDISFKGYKSAPEITLTSQGTGAQSTVLYLAHYILDSDRSLNRGEYHPLWLMEEPESFLHADLLLRLAKQINSSGWTENIQMTISSHSPMLLASSRVSKSSVLWNVLGVSEKPEMYKPSSMTDEEISLVGKVMGDSNFLTYFNISQEGRLIFIEDEHENVFQAYCRSGIPVSKGLYGITDIKKYLDVFSATPDVIRTLVYFVVDGDIGMEVISKYLDGNTPIQSEDGFCKYQIPGIPNVFIVTLPEGCAVEGLFDEYESHLTDCFDKIWSQFPTLKDNIPTYLSAVVTKIRSKRLDTKDSAIELLRNHKDIKDNFWKKVEDHEYKFSLLSTQILKRLLESPARTS